MCLVEHVFECSVIVVGVRRRDFVGEDRRRVQGREEVQEIERESQIEEKRSRGHDYGDDMKGLEPQCVCG